MKFNDYLSGYDSFFGPDGLAKKQGLPRLSPEVFYSEFGAMMTQALEGRRPDLTRGLFAVKQGTNEVNISPLRQCLVEHQWYRLQRPYYNVWPGIIKPLVKLKLDTVKCDQIHLPMTCISFRFAEQTTLFRLENGSPLRSVLVCDSEVGLINDDQREFTLWMDFRDKDDDGVAAWSYRRFLMQPDWSISEAMDRMAKAEPVYSHSGLSPISYSTCSNIMALITGCLLLDTDFIVPEVLNRDKTKPLTDERIARARANGKVGWDIGKEIDVNPHWRRPHPALMWTGKGRTVARITMRKGSIVKRSTIGTIPTGFYDKGNRNADS